MLSCLWLHVAQNHFCILKPGSRHMKCRHMNVGTARQFWSITLLLSSIFTHVIACSGIMRNIWWTEISSRQTLSGVCARQKLIYYSQTKCAQANSKAFQTHLNWYTHYTALRPQQPLGQRSTMDSQCPQGGHTTSQCVCNTLQLDIWDTHFTYSHFLLAPVLLVWVRPRRLTTYTGVKSFVLSV